MFYNLRASTMRSFTVEEGLTSSLAPESFNLPLDHYAPRENRGFKNENKIG